MRPAEINSILVDAIQALLVSLLLIFSCKPATTVNDTNQTTDFNQPVKVKINDYDGNVMEPFLLRDGTILLFNNLNSASENTNLHWATKLTDTTFQYKGEIAGVNTTDLEGVPSVDNADNLYFVSNRNYSTTLSTIYQCKFLTGVATNVHIVDGISKLQAGWVNFDVEVSADGQSLYFVDARFDQTGNPVTADLAIAQKSNAGFQRLANSSELLKNINTDALEYAACISADKLELYFTRTHVSSTGTPLTEILMSTRKNVDAVFDNPSKIQGITGFIEAPTIAPDQKTLYYHKKEGNKFSLYKISKK